MGRTLCSLIGHRREIVTVEDHHFSRRQRWSDEFRDVLLPIVHEILEFILGRESSGRAGFTDFFPPRPCGRFVTEDHFAALGGEPLAKAFCLSGFTGAVDALDDDGYFKIGFEGKDWDVYAYVDNVFNERAVLFDQISAPSGSGNNPYFDTVTINDPRSWGIGFSKSWGGN